MCDPVKDALREAAGGQGRGGGGGAGEGGQCPLAPASVSGKLSGTGGAELRAAGRGGPHPA